MADMKRVNRMVEILSLIDKGGKVTAKGLAERFGVAERTVYRDLGALSLDFPVYFNEDAASYRFTEGYSLKKIDLSTDEARAMLASKAVLSKLGHGIANAYSGLMKKITLGTGHKTGQRLKTVSSNYWFDIDPVDDFSAVQKQFDALQKALDEKVSLDITYHAMGSQKMTQRMINPYGLFYSNGVWYTLAYCHEKKCIREFALDCIQNVAATHRNYVIPQGFSMDEYFKAGWHIIRYGSPVEIKLRFSHGMSRWITRRKWHPSQKIETKKDGSIIFKVTLEGTDEIRRWIYHWGSDCEVLAPPEFRKEVASELKSMAALYQKKNKGR